MNLARACPQGSRQQGTGAAVHGGQAASLPPFLHVRTPDPLALAALARAGRRSAEDSDLDSPTLTRVLARAPLMRLEAVALEAPPGAAAEAGGSENEGEGEEEGEGEHVPSPRRILRAVIPPGGRLGWSGCMACAACAAYLLTGGVGACVLVHADGGLG